jgi:hypothetical protein
MKLTGALPKNSLTKEHVENFSKISHLVIE